MSAVQVVLDQGAFWVLVALGVLASVAALVASIAAWRSARASRAAVGALEAARHELARSTATRPQAQPRPVPRPSDMLIDPDRPGQPLVPAPRPAHPNTPARRPSPPPTTPMPELRTEPLPLARPTPASSPLVSPDAIPGVESPIVAPAPRSGTPAREEVRRPALPGAPAQAPMTNGSRAPDVPREPQRPSDPAAERLRRLTDPDPFVRIEAIEGLRGHPMLVDSLLEALHDDFPVVRRQAVRALKEAGGPRATKALLEVANDDTSAEVREEAVAALGAMLGEGSPSESDRRSGERRA